MAAPRMRHESPSWPGVQQTVKPGSALPSRLVLNRDEVTVGRSTHCNIRVLSPMVSRHHALLTRHASGLWRVEDNSSRHGVFMNGLRVEKSRLLRQGDVISLGRPGRTATMFRFMGEDVWNRGGDGQDAVVHASPAYLVLIGSVANDAGTGVEQGAAAPSPGKATQRLRSGGPK